MIYTICEGVYLLKSRLISALAICDTGWMVGLRVLFSSLVEIPQVLNVDK